MTEFEQLLSDLTRLRARARAVSPEESASWTAKEKTRFNCEIRWCVDALTELEARIKAVTARA
jgi:hypothetical protein